jgi:hypothetical protein
MSPFIVFTEECESEYKRERGREGERERAREREGGRWRVTEREKMTQDHEGVSEREREGDIETLQNGQ